MRTAVIGCGVISDIYFKNISSMFSVLDLVACCDLNTSLMVEMSEKYKLKPYTIEQIIADKSIELVINLTNPVAHYPVIKQLLNAGKHVYTEKTLAVTLEQAKELIELADKNSLYLGVAPDTFLGAAVQTANWAIESGVIGDVTSCYAALNRDSALIAEKYPYTTKQGGGIALDVGIYYITALLSILGPVTQVCAMVETVNKERTHFFVNNKDFGENYTVESENLACGTFRLKSGVIGSIHLNSNCIQNEKPQLVIYGTQGILYMPDPNCFGGEVKVILKGQTEPFTLPHTHAYSENSRGIGASEMAWAIKKNRSPRASKEMGYHCMELLLGMVESGITQKFYNMQSTFTKPLPLPRGYLGSNYFSSQPEISIT